MRKVINGIVALALVVTLTACGAETAATIGKETISLKTVQDAVTLTLKERAATPSSSSTLETGATLNRSMLKFYFYSYVIEQIAKDKKLTVTPAEEAAERKNILDQIGGEAKLPGALVNAQVTASQFPQFIRDQLLTKKIGDLADKLGIPNTNGEAIQALVIKFTKANSVKINPRLGVWDQEKGDITAPVANTAVATSPATTK